MQKVACIVQARLGSTRLPAKVLLPLPIGRTVLEEVLRRCKQIHGIDEVVCAVPDTAENDIVASFAGREVRRDSIIRGPEHDVLARYVKAAEAVGADVIMRVTSDCPLIDPAVCGDVLATFGFADDYLDYCSNVHPRTYPQGFDCEVFTRAALVCADQQATQQYDREHVTPSIINHPDCRKTSIVSPIGDYSHLRWTLDTLDDYIRIWNVFQEQIRAAA